MRSHSHWQHHFAVSKDWLPGLWVLSLPFGLRYRLDFDAHPVRDVLHIFVQAVFGSVRRRDFRATFRRRPES
jgi:hypothetical protein